MRTIFLLTIILQLFYINCIAQPLDWSSDIVVYGTLSHEQFPQIVDFPDLSSFRAFCVKNDSTLSTRVSRDGGQTWGNFDDFQVPFRKPRIVAMSDENYQYAFEYGQNRSEKRFYRFDDNSGGWPTSFRTEISPENDDLVQSAAVYTDYSVEPTDNYLNVLWTEYNAVSGVYQGVFAQSRNHGVSFLPCDTIFQGGLPENNKEVAMTICGTAESEKIIVAAPIERAGSIPQEIRLYSSLDQGQNWSAGVVIDSVTEYQLSPTLYAQDDLVLLAYLRKMSPTARADIYYTYSPDNGSTFAPILAVTESNLAESTPRLLISGENFYLFYIAGIGELGGVFVRVGSLDSPWQLSDTVRISSDYNAVLAAGLSVSSSIEGVCVVWTEEFELGDNDILFDASWRGNSLADLPYIPSQTTLSCFPNPFNNHATLSFSLVNTQYAGFQIYGIDGRKVADIDPSIYTSGTHKLNLDFTNLASGSYFIQSTAKELGKTKLVLLK